MKTLPYVMSLLVAGLSPLGCGHDDSALGDSTTLHGTIDGWSATTGATVGAAALTVPLSTIALTSAPIDASGNFNIEVPNGDAIAPFLKAYDPFNANGSCSVSPNIDPSDLKSAALQLFVKRDGMPDAQLFIASYKLTGPPAADSLGWGLLYADRDAHLGGQFNCSTTLSSNVANYNLDLKKGWNSVTSHYDKYDVSPTDGVQIVTENYAGAIPTSVKWQMIP
jgi:hypothetical protein